MDNRSIFQPREGGERDLSGKEGSSVGERASRRNQKIHKKRASDKRTSMGRSDRGKKRRGKKCQPGNQGWHTNRKKEKRSNLGKLPNKGKSKVKMSARCVLNGGKRKEGETGARGETGRSFKHGLRKWKQKKKRFESAHRDQQGEKMYLKKTGALPRHLKFRNVSQRREKREERERSC